MTWLMLFGGLTVVAAVTVWALLRTPMRRPERTLHDRAQWFAEARTNRGEAADADEPDWDGKSRRPYLEGHAGGGQV